MDASTTAVHHVARERKRGAVSVRGNCESLLSLLLAVLINVVSDAGFFQRLSLNLSHAN